LKGRGEEKKKASPLSFSIHQEEGEKKRLSEKKKKKGPSQVKKKAFFLPKEAAPSPGGGERRRRITLGKTANVCKSVPGGGRKNKKPLYLPVPLFLRGGKGGGKGPLFLRAFFFLR